MPGTKPRHVIARRGYEGYVYVPPRPPIPLPTPSTPLANAYEKDYSQAYHIGETIRVRVPRGWVPR